MPKRAPSEPTAEVDAPGVHSVFTGDDTVDIGPVVLRGEHSAPLGTSELAIAILGSPGDPERPLHHDDFGGRPTPNYAMSVTDEETPVVSGANTLDGPPESAVRGELMDEPPLDEESAPFPPLAAGGLSSHQVELRTADDTAAALKLMHAGPVEVTTESAGTSDESPQRSAADLSDATGGPETSPANQSPSAPPEGATGDAPMVPVEEAQQTRAVRASAAPDAERAPTTKASLPAVETASGQRAGGRRSLAWGGAAAALFLTAWWFISPHDAPRALTPSDSASPVATPASKQASEVRTSVPAPRAEQASKVRTSVPAPSAGEATSPAELPAEAHTPQPAVATAGSAAGASETAPAQAEPAAGMATPTPAPATNAASQAQPDAATGTPSETDKEVARAALREAALSAGRCRIQGDPSGWTRVTVTFESSGQVSYAKVLKEPFKDTYTAECIEARIKRVTIPPFDGGPMTLTHPIEVF